MKSRDPDGKFIPTSEAVRQLTIAKKAEIDLDMKIKRGQRIGSAVADTAGDLAPRDDRIAYFAKNDDNSR